MAFWHCIFICNQFGSKLALDSESCQRLFPSFYAQHLKWLCFSIGICSTHSVTHTLALLPLVKRQVFCVGDRLKMVKRKAWATTIVVPKPVGPFMTMKEQMKPTCRVSLTAPQAGENSQSNVLEHTIVSSILLEQTWSYRKFKLKFMMALCRFWIWKRVDRVQLLFQWWVQTVLFFFWDLLFFF